MPTTFELYENGTLTATLALARIYQELVSLEAEISELQEQRAILRGQISLLVEALGGEAEIAETRFLQLNRPIVTTSYDSVALDRLVSQLQSEHPAIAELIKSCKRESSRIIGLTIKPSK